MHKAILRLAAIGGLIRAIAIEEERLRSLCHSAPERVGKHAGARSPSRQVGQGQ